MPPTILRARLATQTTRLSIRPFQLGDFAAWRTANQEHPPPASHHDPGPRAATELNRQFFRTVVRRNEKLRKNDVFHFFALFDRGEKTMFGSVSLQVVARIHIQNAWIGWRIFGQHRRKGYAREGVGAVIELAFRQLALHRLEAGIEPDNRASIRLARSLRMRKEASYRKTLFARGAWTDLDVYATSSEDWGIEMQPTFAMSLADQRRVESL